MHTTTSIPNPTSFTSAPLRNRMRVELNAPVPEVWALVGNLERLPEYSAGLDRVDVKKNASGQPEEYTCYFKPMAEGGPGPVARERFRWREPNQGWASVESGPSDFGTKNSLHMVTLSPSGEGTLVDWKVHYDAADLEMNRSELDKSFADISNRLVARFGGRVVERYVEGTPAKTK